MKRSFLLVLFLPFFVQAQVEDWKDAISNATTDTAKFRAYINLHNYYFKNEPEKSLAYSEQAWAFAEEKDQPLLRYKAAGMLARCYRKKWAHSKILHYDTLALGFAKQTGNQELVYNATLQMGRDLIDADRLAPAYTWLKQAESMANQQKKASQQADVYQSLAFYFGRMENHRQAIAYFSRAIEMFDILNEPYKAVEAKMQMVESMLKIGVLKKAADYLFEAIAYFQNNNNESRLAYCYQMLGMVYLHDGNAAKGTDYFLQAKELYKKTNNAVQEALTLPDLARIALFEKKYSKARQYIAEAENIFMAQQYSLGLAMVSTLWGQYYSEERKWSTADRQFKKANELLKNTDDFDARLDNDEQWAIHLYRQNKTKEADSLTYSYAAYMVKHKSPETLALELDMMKKRARPSDTGMIKLLTLLYSPGGAEKIKKDLNGKSLSTVLKFDSLATLNPYTKAPASFDSSMAMVFSKQFADLETRYRTRQIKDSLTQQTFATLLAQKDSKNKNIIIIAAVLLLMLVAAGLWLQYKSRRRAERDKARIELLQKEIHHRVKNNLGVINRLVDVAGKGSVYDAPLAALKTRIKSIELLHRHLYSEEARTGNVALQPYFDDLCTAIAATFETAKNIRITVAADAEVDSAVAEKLGLIVNELVTNSFKYAFDGKEEGVIDVKAIQTNKELNLVVQDDGVGLPEEKTKGSYGMKLIKGLSRELNGNFSLRNNRGAAFQLSIPV